MFEYSLFILNILNLSYPLTFILWPIFSKYFFKGFEKNIQLLWRQGIDAGCRCSAATGYKGTAESIRFLSVNEWSPDTHPVCAIWIACK